MVGNPVAEVYADALYALGRDGGNTAALLEELVDFEKLLDEQKDLRVFLEAPGISLSKKTNAADAILGPDFSELFRNFVCVLIEKRRIGATAEIRKTLQAQIDETEGRLRARVVSAVPLSDEQLEAVRTQVSTRTGKAKVELDAQVDASILGGLIIQYGDTYVDGSIAGRLAEVRETLGNATVR